jgi:hypothetical protein
MSLALPKETIDTRIVVLRGCRVMLDADLAALYHVETKALVRAVKRNVARFPSDFMLRLSEDEFQNLRYRFGTSSSWGGRRHLPFAFTEQGVAMLSSVLKSSRAVQVNIEIMRAFVRLRRLTIAHEDLTRRVDDLEKKHDRHDVQLKAVFDAIRALMTPPETPKRRIGFHARTNGH